MRFAYADPPYLGCGKRIYSKHHPNAEIWDDPMTHIELVEQLMDEFKDGWVLSLHEPSLKFYARIIPDDARICAWAKTMHQIWWNVSVQYSWEPVILYGGRKEKNRKPMVRDHFIGARTHRKGIEGSKSDAFNDWVLNLLNFQSGDEIVDLFPGAGGLSRAVERKVKE